jgi:heat shock protein HtpX
MVSEFERPVLVYDRIATNRRNTMLLLVAFFLITSALIIAVGYLMGLPVAFSPFIVLFVLIYVAVAYFAPEIVGPAVSGARGPGTVDHAPHQKKNLQHQSPLLYNTVENLSIGSGLPMPKVYVIEDGAMNAFATGRDPEHSSVAITRGLMSKLDKLELEGVIAHELSHIGNRDTMVMTTLVLLAGVIALLADLAFRMTWFGAGSRRSYKDKNSLGPILIIVALVAAVLAPIAARIITLAVSRQREYLADASGALLTRYPEGLARALEKISDDPDPLDTATKATEHLYFVNPLRDHTSALNNLFATHPPIEERIRLLRAM